jgi:hypothetical protein
MLLSAPKFYTRLYYFVKPLVPRKIRWFLRRRLARTIRPQISSIWPIDESAASPPDGWPGWPEGKRFAVVLTHDVESQVGLNQVRPLAELEMELGFRSSFNFIPEGDYQDPKELRAWLVERGFEVGVHDLSHDGRLYHSRESFRSKAVKINQYLAEWGAVGFRSGFMLRELEWIHDLNLLYDASTFDTDPFEPQPEGAHSIFPFMVHSGAKNYVELPYTLPQDSTLFILLEEKGPAIWLEKLAWLAGKGGLVLLNSHPDYVDVAGKGISDHQYPLAHYRALLERIREDHADQYWHVLPRELATWYKQTHFVPSVSSAAFRPQA